MPGTEGFGGECPLCKADTHLVKHHTDPKAFRFDACAICGFAYGAASGHEYTSTAIWHLIATRLRVTSLNDLRLIQNGKEKAQSAQTDINGVLSGAVYDYRNDSTAKLRQHRASFLPIPTPLAPVVVEDNIAVGKRKVNGEHRITAFKLCSPAPDGEVNLLHTTYESFNDRAVYFPDQIEAVQYNSKKMSTKKPPMTYKSIGYKIKSSEWTSDVKSLAKQCRKKETARLL